MCGRVRIQFIFFNIKIFLQLHHRQSKEWIGECTVLLYFGTLLYIPGLCILHILNKNHDMGVQEVHTPLKFSSPTSQEKFKNGSALYVIYIILKLSTNNLLIKTPSTYHIPSSVTGVYTGASLGGRNVWYSWVSLGYFAVNLSGGQPKMY